MTEVHCRLKENSHSLMNLLMSSLSSCTRYFHTQTVKYLFKVDEFVEEIMLVLLMFFS